MIRAVIIDDEQKGINSLRLLIERYVPEVKLIAETTSAEQGIKTVNDYHPEIVFLDINMPIISGFGLLEKVSFRNFFLVFTTAHEEYALQALKQNAVDYLLKPIDKDDLISAVNKIKERINEKLKPDYAGLLTELNKNNTKRLAIPTKEGLVFEAFENVQRLEADSNYTRIYLTNGQFYIVPKTLKEFENNLCEESNLFMRLHQSHIVNLTQVGKYIKENGGIVVMRDNFQIPLSKNKKDEFLKWLDE